MDNPLSLAPELKAGAAEAPITRGRRGHAWSTYLTCATMVVLFLGIQLDGSKEAADHWGYRSATDIWRGARWALLTSTFVHVAVWHLALNLYWVWILGRMLEPVMGAWKLLALIVATGIISSSVQLAMSGGTGIGASGVVYGLFAFAWVLRHREPSFDAVLTLKLINSFVVWFFVCWIALYREVGNWAHLGGALAGAVAAEAFVMRRKPPLAITGAALLLLSIGVAFFCPWQSGWWNVKAYDLHVAQKYRLAADAYEFSLDLEPKQPWALGNLVLAHRAEGNEAAMNAALERLRALDPAQATELEAGEPSPQKSSQNE